MFGIAPTMCVKQHVAPLPPTCLFEIAPTMFQIGPLNHNSTTTHQKAPKITTQHTIDLIEPNASTVITVNRCVPHVTNKYGEKHKRQRQRRQKQMGRNQSIDHRSRNTQTCTTLNIVRQTE